MRFVTSVVARSTSCYHVSGPCCLSADTFFAIICIIIINNYRTAGGVWPVADTENCEKLRSQQRQVLYTNSVQYLVQYYHIYNQILDCFFFFFFLSLLLVIFVMLKICNISQGAQRGSSLANLLCTIDTPLHPTCSCKLIVYTPLHSFSDCPLGIP